MKWFYGFWIINLKINKVEKDSANLEEEELKNLLSSKPKNKDINKDPQFCALKEIIENAKEGFN